MSKCRDVMTGMPMCCLPNDTIDKAVNIMKLADVGSVPVIDDYETKQLLGIVTDRDVVVKSVAPNAKDVVFVSEIMTRKPATCRPDDDVEEAMKLMAERQVRRIPVVDEEGRLLGIIAQGDIAASVDRKKTGDVVKEISKLT